MKIPKKNKDWKEHILPSIIKIGYQDIRVSEVDFIDGAQGVYISDNSEIRIKEGMSESESLNTILHECLHAIVYVYGIKNDFEDNDEEEKIVNALGNGLTEIFLRNPNLIKFIVKSVSA